MHLSVISIHQEITILGSAGRRDEESPEEAYYYNTKVAPIVEEMATHIKGNFSIHLFTDETLLRTAEICTHR